MAIFRQPLSAQYKNLSQSVRKRYLQGRPSTLINFNEPGNAQQTVWTGTSQTFQKDGEKEALGLVSAGRVRPGSSVDFIPRIRGVVFGGDLRMVRIIVGCSDTCALRAGFPFATSVQKDPSAFGSSRWAAEQNVSRDNSTHLAVQVLAIWLLPIRSRFDGYARSHQKHHHGGSPGWHSTWWDKTSTCCMMTYGQTSSIFPPKGWPFSL